MNRISSKKIKHERTTRAFFSMLADEYVFIVSFRLSTYAVVGVLVKDNFNRKTLHQQPGYAKDSKMVLLVI